MRGSTDNRKSGYEDAELLLNDRAVIEGVVDDIIFRNESNGYSVVSLSGDDEIIAVGILPFLTPGESVRLSGKWNQHPDYGRQLQVEHYELIAPGSKESIIRYLSMGIIRGIGEKSAQKLVREYGEQTLDILRDNPEKVARLKGFSLEKARRIADQLREKKDYQDLVLFLTPLGIGPGKILRIYRQFGRDSLRMISENPFRLADEVYGIGFATADKLAQQMGLDPQSPQRFASAIKYLLYQTASQGNTYCPLDSLFKETEALLGQATQMYQPALDMLQNDRQIVISGRQFGDSEDGRVALAGLFRIEKIAAERFSIIAGTRPSRFTEMLDFDKASEIILSSGISHNMELAPEQRTALIEALRNTALILTGGPGTGKTTIIKLLCESVKKMGGNVLLAAPTGRAARRLTETTGFEAKTLHRLLEIQYTPDENRSEMLPARESGVILSCDMLIVDEMSMVDANLFKCLLAAVTPGTRLVLVGDVDQLPSIGAGYVLKDLIESGKAPVVRLTQVFRQSQQSLIVQNAYRIHEGRLPDLNQSHDSQFLWIFKDTPDEIANAVVKLCRTILPEQYNLDSIRDVQVLTPYRKGPAGMLMLNQHLQKALNDRVTDKDSAHTIEAHGCRFHTGDKVMQIRNNYDLEWISASDDKSPGHGVFNGETGMVTALDTDAQSLQVLFDDDRLVEYDRANLEDLDLAYAITIHKSQGSEYPVVVLAIPPGAPQMLTRNLLYTAVTRARSKLLLVASRRTVAGMIANNQAYSRFTFLRDWLSQ